MNVPERADEIESGSGASEGAEADGAPRPGFQSRSDAARAVIVLNSIGDAVISADLSGHIDYLNPAAEYLTGWSLEEALGRPIRDVFRIVDGRTRRPDYNPLEQVLRQDRTLGLPANTLLIRRDGSETPIEDSTAPIHDGDGPMTGAVVVFRDVSATQAMTRRMTHLAQHDFLTDLPNRTLLDERLRHSISLARRRDAHLAVFFVDLDHFKHVNDSLGHATGDLLLCSVAERLSACLRDSDSVCRQGGDEFVLLLIEVNRIEDAAAAAERIILALEPAHAIGGQQIHVSASIGISFFPVDGHDAATLMRNADIAMYTAKEAGRNNYQFFNAQMNVQAVDRQQIEAGLWRALERQEFALVYQPILDLATLKVTGAEALLRWADPDGELILPRRFLAVAEDSRLIVPIGRWVLHEACAQAKRWHDSGLGEISVAVNISAVEFRQGGFVEGVRTVLGETGLAAALLQLEITESVLMRDSDASASALRELAELGVRLALDDFGTGYSSLSYLNRFPIDILKIDQSFVQDVATSRDHRVIVSAVIAMARSLGKRVVAEGVEDQAQLRMLRTLDCEAGQGYLFGRPVPPDEFAALVEAAAIAAAARPVA